MKTISHFLFDWVSKRQKNWTNGIELNWIPFELCLATIGDLGHIGLPLRFSNEQFVVILIWYAGLLIIAVIYFPWTKMVFSCVMTFFSILSKKKCNLCNRQLLIVFLYGFFFVIPLNVPKWKRANLELCRDDVYSVMIFSLF